MLLRITDKTDVETLLFYSDFIHMVLMKKLGVKMKKKKQNSSDLSSLTDFSTVLKEIKELKILIKNFLNQRNIVVYKGNDNYRKTADTS